MPTISSVNAIYPEDFSSGGYTSGFYSKRNGHVYVLDRLSTHAEILMQMFPEVVNAETLEDDESFYKAIAPILKSKGLLRLKKANGKLYVDTNIVPLSLEEKGDMIENFTYGSLRPKFDYPMHSSSITKQFREKKQVNFKQFYLMEVGNASGHFDRPKNGPDILAIGRPLGSLKAGQGGFKGAAQIGVPDVSMITIPTELLKGKKCKRCEKLKKKKKKKDDVKPKTMDAQDVVDQPMKNTPQFISTSSGTQGGWY